MTCCKSTEFTKTGFDVCRFLLDESDLPGMLQGVCDRLVSSPQIFASLMVLVDQDAGGMVTAETGLGKELEEMIEQLKQGSLPECGVQANATEEPTAFTCDPVPDISSSSNQTPENGVCISIKCTSALHGFIVLHIHRQYTISAPDLELFKQVGEAVSHALRRLFKTEKTRRRIAELQATEKRFELALDASQAGLWDWNIKSGEMYISPNQREYLHYHGGESSGTEMLQTIHPEDKDRVFSILNDHLAGKTKEYRIEYRVRAKNGELLWFLDRGRVVERDENNMPVRMTGTHQNITRQKQKEHALAAIQQQFHEAVNHERQFLQTVIDSAGDPVMVIDLEYTILLINKTAARLIPGYTKGMDLQNQKCYQLFCKAASPCNNANFPCPVQEMQLRPNRVQMIHKPYHGNDINNTFELDVSPLYNQDDQLVAVIEVARDVTDRLRIEKELRDSQSRLYRLAHHDTLTGLPNRLLFMDRLHQATIRAARTKKSVAIMFLDLDKFKHINDSLGHDVGDGLLIEVSARLQRQCRESDTVSRMGGDEFIFILDGIMTKKDVGIIAGKILRSMEKPVLVEKNVIDISTSIGIALYPDDSADIDGVIKCADLALYESKKQGRNTYRFFHPRLLENESHLR